MKIAIPTENKSIKADVSQVFGRTTYFLIYDNDTSEVEYILNTAVNSQGGAGIKAAQIIIDNKVNVLLAPRLGLNAADLLKLSDIKLFKTTDSSIENNISDYKDNTLEALNDFHAGFHNHGEG